MLDFAEDRDALAVSEVFGDMVCHSHVTYSVSTLLLATADDPCVRFIGPVATLVVDFEGRDVWVEFNQLLSVYQILRFEVFEGTWPNFDDSIHSCVH